MPHAVGAVFVTPTVVSGTVYALSATASTATSNSKTTYGALTSNATAQMSPEKTTASGATLPAAGTAWNSIGWQYGSPLIPLSDPGVLQAGSVSVTASLVSSNSLAYVVNIILYVGTVEIGRYTSASTTVSTTAVQFTGTINYAQTNIPAGASINMAVWVTVGTNLNLGTTTVTLQYNTTGTRIAAGLNYVITASRAASDTQSTSDITARTVSLHRPVSDTLATSDVTTRAYQPVRATADSTSVSDAAQRIYLAARLVSDNIPVGSDAVARKYVGYRTIIDSVPTSDVVTRRLIYGRFTYDQLTSGGTGSNAPPIPTIYQVWPRGDNT